jgi:hypothetical protein
MTQKTKAALLAALCAALAGCDTAPKTAVTKCELGQAIPGAAKTDILFVVDDSGSMSDNQKNLADNFDAFIQVLASSPVKNDFQIGITTTSVSDFPRSTGGPDPTTYIPHDDKNNPCPNANKPYPAGELVAFDPGSGVLNYELNRILAASSSTLVEGFKNDVMVGTWGSGKEQGLRAMKLALSDRIADGTNAGFLRPDARLAVIIVSDEDDYSELHDPGQVIDNDNSHKAATKANPDIYVQVQSYVDFLHGTLAGQGRDVTVAVIAGVDPATKKPAAGAGSACATAYDTADRYAQFANAFGSKGLIDSVCTDFRGTLTEIAGLLDPGQNMPLEQVPADWRMLSVSVVSAAGTRTNCSVGLDGAGGTPDVVYTPPIGATRASLTFVSDACKLHQGDRVDLKVLCAG